MKDTASSGNRDFYFSPRSCPVGAGYGESYQTVVKDIVTLPDIKLIAELAERRQIARGEAYWLDTPYFNNGYMVRCVRPTAGF